MSWTEFAELVKEHNFYHQTGQIVKVSNLSIEAEGVRGNVGDLCIIKARPYNTSFFAQIVSQSQESTLLMPFGDTEGIGVDSEIECLHKPLTVEVGDMLLGKVIDPLGNSMSSDGHLNGGEKIFVKGKKHNPLKREAIVDYLMTGVKAIDSLLAIGEGQRIGIFAGSGVGKSTLLGMIAKKSYADINVIALIGERGREVNDFINKTLDQDSLERSVIVVATADQPTLVRELAAHTATSIAEHFSNKGKNVMLIMDSVTRFAMARREIGLSIGEPATARGYTPSTFTELPKLIERAGKFSNKGSITGIYTVLVEGDDFNEPVSDHMRAILDGHIMLSRELANQGHYPAIDVLKSISRLASDIWTESEKSVVKSALKLLSLIEKYKDIVEIGAYKEGSNPKLDQALLLYPKVQAFLSQSQSDEEDYTRDSLFEMLKEAIGS
ncbi:MAG: FliI/YscN family ATPase [Methylotenera sp.]